MVSGFVWDWISFGTGLLVGAVAVWRLGRRKRRPLDRIAPPVPLPPIQADVKAAVLKMRAEGRIIEAIKLVHDKAGCDLRTAKEFVDKIR